MGPTLWVGGSPRNLQTWPTRFAHVGAPLPRALWDPLCTFALYSLVALSCQSRRQPFLGRCVSQAVAWRQLVNDAETQQEALQQEQHRNALLMESLQLESRRLWQEAQVSPDRATVLTGLRLFRRIAPLHPPEALRYMGSLRALGPLQTGTPDRVAASSPRWNTAERRALLIREVCGTVFMCLWPWPRRWLCECAAGGLDVQTV